MGTFPNFVNSRIKFRKLRESSRNSGTYMNLNILDVGNKCSFNSKEFIFIPNFGLCLYQQFVNAT
jgi:hypothetical protein